MVDGVPRFIGQRKELGIGFSLSHWEFIGEFVIAFDRFTAGCFACDGCSHARLCNVVANAVLFPIGITGAQALFARVFARRLRLRYL